MSKQESPKNAATRASHRALLFALSVIGLVAATGVVVTEVHALILNTSHDVVRVPAPPSVVNDDFESDVQIRAFPERACFLTEEVIEWDNGFIPAGRWVETYLVHSDHVTDNLPGVLRGRVRFDGQIIGVITSSAGLDATDATLGNPATLYPIPGSEPFRGHDLATPNDFCRPLAPDVLGVRHETPLFSDQCRVLVDCG